MALNTSRKLPDSPVYEDFGGGEGEGDRDYTYVSAWEAANRGNLTAAGADSPVLVCYADKEYYNISQFAVDFSGANWVINDTMFPLVMAHADHRHGGRLNQGVIFKRQDATLSAIITTTYAVARTPTAPAIYDIVFIDEQGGGSFLYSNGYLNYNKFRDGALFYVGNIFKGWGCAVWCFNDAWEYAKMHMINNLFIDCSDYAIYVPNSGCFGSRYNIYFVNNTFHSCGTAVRMVQYGTHSNYNIYGYAVNNICQNCTTNFSFGSKVYITEATNAKDLGVSFVDAANDDFNLADDDLYAIDEGTDYEATLDFNDDIAGVERTGDWDIGAFEFVEPPVEVNLDFDAILKKTGVAQSTDLDAALQVTGLTEATSLDVMTAILRALTTGLDGIFQKPWARLLLDAAVQNGDLSFAELDALLQSVGVGQTTGLDAALLAAGFNQTEVDALLQGRGFASLELDGMAQKQGLAAQADMDALLAVVAGSAALVDALLQGSATKSAAMDAYLLLPRSKTVLDALLQAALAGQLSLDAFLARRMAALVSLDAAVQGEGLSQIASLDAAVMGQAAGQTDLDAALLAARTGQTGVDALLQAGFASSASLDALIRASYGFSTALDAALMLLGTKTLSLDAMLFAANSGQIDLDALLQGIASKALSLDALLALTRSGSLALDAWLAVPGRAGALFDAVLVQVSRSGVSLHALVQRVLSHRHEIVARPRKTLIAAEPRVTIIKAPYRNITIQ